MNDIAIPGQACYPPLMDSEPASMTPTTVSLTESLHGLAGAPVAAGYGTMSNNIPGFVRLENMTHRTV
ncbi:MAG: hypothetical protein AB1486_31355 [Planctomycetota bacterium]